MRVGRFAFSAASLAVLVVQLLLVSTVAAKYLYRRWTSPRVWTPAVTTDAEPTMRGRYIAAHLIVDGCQSTLPSAKTAQFPRDVNGAVKPGLYVVRPSGVVQFQGELKVVDNKLIAVKIEDPAKAEAGEIVTAGPGSPCDQMRLDKPVDFYIAERAQSPLPLRPGQQLWIEVTVPHRGPPRPIQMAVKDNGVWKPLE